MTAPPDSQVSPAELRALDAQYRPFPDFQTFCAAVAVDTDLWERVAAGLQQKQAGGAQADFDRAVEVALRAAAVDTGAIEGLYKVDHGFTVTVAEEQPGWEAEADKKGAAFRQLFASQLRGYKLARELSAGATPINEAWIRELHSEITAGQPTYQAWIPTLEKYQQQALPRGQYKTGPNHVRRADGDCHAYAPVDDVPMEMQRLLEQMRSPEFGAAHPSLQAAYAHYALVVIHPFADGNGRVARAVASTFLIKSCDVPLVVWSDQDDEYIDALGAADRGNYQAFVDFIFDRALDTMGDVVGRMGPAPEDVAADLRSLLHTQGGLSHGELEQVGVELFGQLMRSTANSIRKLSLPRDVSCEDGLVSGSGASNDGRYRPPLQQDPRTVTIQFRSVAPAEARLMYELQLLIAKDKAARYPFLLKRVNPLDEFPVRLADVYPEVGDSLTPRIDAWVERMLAEGLRSLAQWAEQSLREAGY